MEGHSASPKHKVPTGGSKKANKTNLASYIMLELFQQGKSMAVSSIY